jgi:hypothetical protein
MRDAIARRPKTWPCRVPQKTALNRSSRTATMEREASLTYATSTDAYENYRQLCGGAPVLSHDELRVEVRAAGLRYEELDEAFWTTLFRRPDHRHLG